MLQAVNYTTIFLGLACCIEMSLDFSVSFSVLGNKIFCNSAYSSANDTSNPSASCF